MTQQSPIHDLHLQLGGRMVPFAGWEMPVQYAGIVVEHNAVRESCGVFDISHMGEFRISGPGALEALNRLLTNDLAKLEIGEGQYTLMLNENGGVIDDLIAYRDGAESYFLVVNASMIAEDAAWMRAHLPDGGITFHDDSAAFAGMAIQGPDAPEVFAKMGVPAPLPARNGIAEAEGVIVCRTGYTGEDGLELFCASSEGEAWFRRAIDAGATPCGLGARDTLRLEMGYPLNGSDLSPERTPLEAGLGFFVALGKGDFIGRGVLAKQKENGLPSRLAAFAIEGKAPPPRHGYPILHGGLEVGEIGSGALSPSLGIGIGMAYLPPALAKIDTALEIGIRSRQFPARVVKKPFYKKS
jgi:aminomethyltransferase